MQGETAQGLGYEAEKSPTLTVTPSCGGGVLTIKRWFNTKMETIATSKTSYHMNPMTDGTASSLVATDYKDPPTITIGGGHEMNENIKTTVRRLTPLECERLQGFPDGWTDIGEWTDTKGKKHKDADSPRYKALGNSIANPFWFYLMRRISAQYERPATLGSLFDGIGGFPYCWERCNGKGTAIWASEIEEFPIAVTKMRFGEE